MYEKYLNTVSVVTDNFLSSAECADIQNKILSLKNDWRSVSRIGSMHFLPLAMYTLTYETYTENAVKYKPLMYKMFGSYYEKIKSSLSELLKIDVDYHDLLSYPGFHIGTEMAQPNFHYDVFLYLDSIIENRSFANKIARPNLLKTKKDNQKILSVIIPITVPDQGSGLLLRYNNYKDRISNEYDDCVDYKPGMLAIWDGSIEHSIRPFKSFTADNFRITMQLHVAIKDNYGYLFW